MFHQISSSMCHRYHLYMCLIVLFKCFLLSRLHICLLPPELSPSSSLPNVPSESIVFHTPTLDVTSSYIPIELIGDLSVEPHPSMSSGHPLQIRSKSDIHKPKKLYLDTITSSILHELDTYDKAKGILKW